MEMLTYIRKDGYIERITSEDCILSLNDPPEHPGQLPVKDFKSEHIKRYSIWDEYDALDNICNVRLEQRRIQCNYHIVGLDKHKRVYKGDRQITETSDSFTQLRNYALNEWDCTELPCSESDSLLLVVSYARDIIDAPPLLKNINNLLNSLIKQL